MELLRFETPAIAHYAYLIADGGVAALVDPRRDVEEYLEAARRMGVRIGYVIETHRQEDFVMGSAHLAARTGAKVVNGKHECFGRGDMRLEDGDAFEIGSLRIVALHTPGHTPESMSYAVYPKETPKQAWAVFSGDALFFGDTGRTDLPGEHLAEQNAALLYDMVHSKIAPLGDGTLLLPAHGAGSVCGSGMASRPLSTLGAEKRYNQVFTLDRASFAAKKGSERIPRPPYFRHMEEVNLRGGLPPKSPLDVPLLSPDELAQREKGSILFDTREPEAYAGGHIPAAHAVWSGGLAVFGGWIAKPDSAIYLCTDGDTSVTDAVLHLSRIGIDGVRGALRGGFGTWRSAGRPIDSSGTITPRELAEQRDRFMLLDVRDEDEFAEGHVPGAVHVYVGHLEERLPALRLDRDAPIAVTCSVGHRSGLAASILRRARFSKVHNLLGGMTAWSALGFPMERKRR